MIKRIFVLFCLIVSYFFLAFPVLALSAAQEKLVESECLFSNADVTNVVTINCLPVIVGNVIFWLLVFAGIVALILIIISGFKFVTSGGEPKKAEGARKTLTYAVIGLFVILISFGIVAFIAQQTGVGCIRRFGFTQCVPEDINQPCGRLHPNGYCEDERKECLPRNDRPGFDPACQFRCGARKGWCPSGKTCRVITVVGGSTVWGCRN